MKLSKEINQMLEARDRSIKLKDRKAFKVFQSFLDDANKNLSVNIGDAEDHTDLWLVDMPETPEKPYTDATLVKKLNLNKKTSDELLPIAKKHVSKINKAMEQDRK